MISSSLRDVVVIESPVEIENDTGEVETVYREFRGPIGSTHRANIRQTSASEAASRGGISSNAGFSVEMRPVPGLAPTMRLRWKSRDDRLLYISGILENGVSVRWLSLTCEERPR